MLPVAVVAVLLGALVRAQSRPPLGADGYFHLRMGHELLGGWSIRDPGHLGPFDTADWVPTQWLAQIGMAAIEDRAGLAGVMWVGRRAGARPRARRATYVCCRTAAAPLPAAFATILACSAASPGFSARPQVFSYLFVLVVTAAWLATLRDGRARWWLVAVAWVWAPLHGMWPFGIVIAVAAIVGLALERDRATVRQLGRLALIPLLSALVVLATPLGLGVYGSVLAVGSRAQYFAEWGPTDFTEPYAIALLAMFAVVLLVGLKRRRLPWAQLLLVGLAGALAVSSARMTTMAALMLAPLVAEALQEFVPDGPGICGAVRRWRSRSCSRCAAASSPPSSTRARTTRSRRPGWTRASTPSRPAPACSTTGTPAPTSCGATRSSPSSCTGTATCSPTTSCERNADIATARARLGRARSPSSTPTWRWSTPTRASATR